jgi:hypothetical protein
MGKAKILLKYQHAEKVILFYIIDDAGQMTATTLNVTA